MADASTLLPSGFRDVLPPEAATESEIVARLLACFESFGYQQVKPPLVEFEDTLLSGTAAGLAAQMFRVMDPASQRMMGLRTDMTPQIARIASVRLAHKPRPLRLSYSGQAVRVKGEGLGADRQLAQAGIELIGEGSVAADIEAVYLGVEALRQAGVADLTVDFSLPQLAGAMMTHLKTPDAVRRQLLALLAKKDIASIRQMGNPAADWLAQALPLAGADISHIEKGLTALQLPLEGREAVRRLRQVAEGLKAMDTEIALTADPLDCRGAGYHTGIGFSFYSQRTEEELGRGGRYALGSSPEDAVGFTLAVNAIQRARGRRRRRRRVYVPYGVPYIATAALRKKGAVAVHGLADVPDAAAEAARLKCDAVWQDGEAVRLD